MTYVNRHLSIMFAAILIATLAAQSNEPIFRPSDKNERMAWWREAKFGMFIHWGVYAVLAGHYEDVRDGEWIMHAGKIPLDRYRGYARQFNAGQYDPAAWADLAARAGMRYVVITAKHHDGFALYPSEVTDWDVMDAAGAKRDLLAPLAREVRKRNLKFGLYYSQAQDWYHPGGAKYRYPEGTGWDKAQQGSFDDYIRDIAVPQVREILTRYEPDVLWWDFPMDMTTARASPLAELLKLRPGIISNDRLGGGYMGDTETPENYIPPVGFPGRDWETCMTMNDNWGYVRDDNDWLSFREIITQLVDIVSKGGNYLLNVGPDADGRIPQPSIDLLTQVGAWMKVNGESIYETQASPFKRRIPWGRVTTKPDGSNTLLYLHVLDMPKDGRLLLTGLKNECLSARFLADGSAAKLERSPFGPCVIVPESKCPQGSFGTTIKVWIKGHPEVEPMPVLADDDGIYRLYPMDAKLTGEIPLDQQFGYDRIGPWKDPTATVSWSIHASKAGSYRLLVRSVTPDSAGPALSVRGIGDFQFEIPASKTWKRDYPVRELGTVTLREGERFEIELKPVAKEWKPVYIHLVELVPAEHTHRFKKGK